MNEIERYAGLTISDKPALLDAQKNGHTYIYLNHDGFKTVCNVNLALAQIEEMESAETYHKMLPSGMEPITMTNDLSREICENYTDPIAPKTNKSVLLERWAKDTREMARRMIWYDAQRRCYHSVDGYGENLTFSGFDELDEAWEHQIAHLNSAAEVGK